MAKLIVQHDEESAPSAFDLVRQSDGKRAGPYVVPSPVGFPVEGMPDSDLMKQLRWYLEIFLDHPFPPFTDRAKRIQVALRAWGKQAFLALFGDRSSARLFDAATEEQYAKLHLEISCDDPKILHWPWEALEDPEVGVLARTCQVTRRLNRVRDPHPLSDDLPKSGVNILLVTARPYQSDVQFRSISRPLVDQIARHNLPATVTLLRPPTFDQLRSHLADRPNHYHILHFDGHGSYGPAAGPTPHTLRMLGPQGQLIFEDAKGLPDAQKAALLSELLREHNVPIVVLNACQSAMVDGTADDAFASVAAGLQRSGVRSVVAMAYSLFVSGAQQFLPAFYRQLFQSGNVADAVRMGRQQMLAQPERTCARGKFPLDDWLVPVLYEQDPVALSFASTFRASVQESQPVVPDEAQEQQNPYGLIGRDRALLTMERAMHRPPAGILVHGLGGIGKTTLTRGFVNWLAVTGGLGRGCFWFSFQDVRTAEHIINQLVGTLFGTNALAETIEAKTSAVARTLREHPFLVVWDNFEVVNDADRSAFTDPDRRRLKDFLKALRGGRTKVVITSRSAEDWLEAPTCFRFSIRGLQGEERWEFCEAIVRDLGLVVDRSSPDWKRLLDMLEGHPLAIRVILSKLQSSTASQLMVQLEDNLLQFVGQDEDSAKLFATLRFIRDTLPADLERLLVPLSLHERFVDADYLTAMGEQVEPPVQEADVDRLMQSLSLAGLLSDRGRAIFELHPALARYLWTAGAPNASADEVEKWSRAFVDIMGTLADQFTPKQLHEKRFVFHVHGSNFRRALVEGERLQMGDDQAALVQSLATFAENTRDFQEAIRLFGRLASSAQKAGDYPTETVAWHQLGRIAEEQRDFVTAEQWYRKSLAISEKQENEDGASSTYAQLGSIAQKQRDFVTAEQWYRKSLVIKEKRKNECGAAITYHQLGTVALEQRDFATAERWYRKSLAISERHGDEYGATSTYHQLGTAAQEQRDFATAERWYRKSLAISERQGNEHVAAHTYCQLGISARMQRDFVTAEQWLRKSLAISEKQGNEHDAAITYHSLGMIGREQRDYATAEQWYRKSLAISEKQGNEHGAAKTYHELGMIGREQRDFATAEQWYRKSLAIKEKQGNKHGVAITFHELGMIAQMQGDFATAEQYYRKTLAILERQTDEYGTASAYYQMGMLAEEQQQYERSGELFVRAIKGFENSDPHALEIALSSFARLYHAAPESTRTVLRRNWEDAALGPFSTA